MYFAAGLFPLRGMYLCAIDARQGHEIWKVETGVSAQGYMVASPRRLFLSTGRWVPHIYDRTGGKHVGTFPGGGSFAVLAGDIFVHAGGEKEGLQLSKSDTGEKIATTDGHRMVVSGSMAYIAGADQLFATDRTAKASVRWQVPCPFPYELIIVAGDTVFLGGEDVVIAYSTETGEVLWRGKVKGKAHSLAVSGGRLFASTDTGHIHCFGPASESTHQLIISQKKVSDESSVYPRSASTQRYEKAAQGALDAVGVKKG